MESYPAKDQLDRELRKSRRIICFLALLTPIMILLWIETASRSFEPYTWNLKVELGRPGFKFAEEDEWEPAEDRNPIDPVYDEFPRYVLILRYKICVTT